jgi:hypothetical protein
MSVIRHVQPGKRQRPPSRTAMARRWAVFHTRVLRPSASGSVPLRKSCPTTEASQQTWSSVSRFNGDPSTSSARPAPSSAAMSMTAWTM